ncbi:hypothetical protein D3C78_1948990 [compost metagenome]
MGRMHEDAGALGAEGTASLDMREEAADLAADHDREDMARLGMAFARREDHRALVVA